MNDEQLFQEATKIWNNLNELSKNDPIEYKNLIKTRLEEGAPFFAEGDKGITKVFPCFCVKLQTSREKKEIRNHYINVCHSLRVLQKESIDFLIDLELAHEGERQDKDGIKYKVYDVIVHPMVITKCKKDEEFKTKVIDIMIKSIKKEFMLTKLKRCWKEINIAYKGAFKWDDSGNLYKEFPTIDDPKAIQDYKSNVELKRILAAKKTDLILSQENITLDKSTSKSINLTEFKREPKFNLMDRKLVLLLPGETNVESIKLSASCIDFEFNSDLYQIQGKFSEIVDSNSIQAKYDKTLETLTITWDLFSKDLSI